jgi:hypothetical protein
VLMGPEFWRSCCGKPDGMDARRCSSMYTCWRWCGGGGGGGPGYWKDGCCCCCGCGGMPGPCCGLYIAGCGM